MSLNQNVAIYINI